MISLFSYADITGLRWSLPSNGTLHVRIIFEILLEINFLVALLIRFQNITIYQVCLTGTWKWAGWAWVFQGVFRMFQQRMMITRSDAWHDKLSCYQHITWWRHQMETFFALLALCAGNAPVAVLCCGYTLTDFPISIRLTSLALWQSNDCPNASKATLMNMDKYFMWIHYERLHNHNKAKHNKTVCKFLGIYCMSMR